MPVKKTTITAFYLFFSLLLAAQEATGVQSEIRKMSRETDPVKSVAMKNRIIKEFKLDTVKDSETIDLLNGNVAVAFAMKKNYAEFDKYISLIRNFQPMHPVCIRSADRIE